MGIISILSTVIGVVARGKSAKAIGGAIPGVLVGILAGPEMMDAFGAGFAEGATPAAHMLGQALGGVLLGAVNFAFAWLAPKNKG
jgi:hypothetical protein